MRKLASLSREFHRTEVIAVTSTPPIVYAVMANDKNLVLTRIQAGLDINYVDPVRSTALSAATMRGDASMITFLLAHGANPLVKDGNGKDTYDYIRKHECVVALGASNDPRFAWIKPEQPKPTRLPDFTSPRDFDSVGGEYQKDFSEITGISAFAGGGGYVNEEYITTTNELVAWRDKDGVFHPDKLLLLKPVLPDQSFRIPAKVVVRLTVQFNHGRTRAAVIDADLSPRIDVALSSFVEQYLTPKVIDHPLLGPLTEDRQYGGYAGTMSFLGRAVSLSFDGELTETALKQALSIVGNPEHLSAQLRQVFSTLVLDLKNSSWLDDEENPITVSEAESEAVPSIITVYEDGDLEFWCGGERWFAGHSVVAKHRHHDGSWHIDLVG